MQYTCQAPVYSSLDIAEKVVPRSQFNESLKRFVLVLKWVAGKLETVVDYGQTCCDIISLIQHLERGNVEKPAISEVLTDSLVSGDLYRVLAEELFAFSLNNSVCSSHEDVVTFLINRGATFPSYFDLGLLSALPIHQESHCIMVEAIMKLHLRVTMTCESVSLSRSEVLGDREMPISWTDVEAILLSWINDTASCVNEYLSVRSRGANHQVRSRDSSLSLDRCRPEDCLELSSGSKSSGVEVVPMAEDVCQDLCDGQSLLSILSFYFPSAVPVHSVCLKKLMSFSDCVKNLSRVHEFCTSESYSESCANVEPWLLGVEELIYPNLSLKVHVINALVQLFLALKHTPISLTLMPPPSHIQLPNSEPSSSETKVVQAGQDDYSDPLDGQELSPKQRSMSMSSFNDSRASLDTAGDALMELENRWEQNPQNSSHSDSKFPDNNNPGRHSNTLRKPRERSEDSAIGTMSTTSDTSTRDCRLSLLRVDSGTKTYSKSNSKTSSNRTSVHELIDSYEQEPRPLSAMKQTDRNSTPASERRSNQSGSSSTGNSGNVRTFARPKSAFGERTLVDRNKYEDSDDAVSEAEMRVGLSGQDPLQVCSGNDLGVAGGSSSTKLSAIKQKMEERRKNIQMERTRLELARSQQRQKMGKTAFMRVMKTGCENATSECSSQAESEEEQQKLKDDDSSDQSSALDLEVLRRHSNKSERSNCRERAKSTHLEAMGYMSGPEMLDNSPRKRSMEIQTSMNFDDRGRSPAVHKSPSSTFTRGRPISCVERDDMESWSSGFGSNQSTLRRTKALTRPVTEDRHSLQHTSSSMDLRSSLERDMLIEQNQLLSRELETLKQKFAVELETRKLNSEREQFELQRQFELNKHSNNVNNMINNAVSNRNHPQAQYWNMSPSNPNQNRLPLLQQPHPATHQPPLYAMTPTYVLNSPGQIYPNRNSATLQFFSPQQPAVHQRKPFYPYQQVQPPYALHEQEVYHNYETTHKQEYNYETLHGSHHNFYQQPYPSYPHNVSSTEFSQVPHAPIDAPHNVFVQKPSATRRTSDKSLEPDTKFAPMNHKRSQGQRPQSLPMATSNGFQGQNAKGTAKDTFDSTSVVSPLDPDLDDVISSSVEVTPESSPVRQLAPRNQERPNSLSPQLIIEQVSKHQDAPPTVAQTGSPKPLRKGGEAFAVNFFTSASNGQTNGSSKEMPPKNRFNMHKRAPVKKSTAVPKDDIDAEKRARESPPNRAVINASSKSSNLVDEALKIVKEGELDLSVPCKKGGVALIIDVESLEASPVNATQTMAADKRREKEQEFLRRQQEKKQKDLERRQKLSEAANAASQQRLTQENQTQELKRQEAAARRERIMAQYLQKKAEKELEDSGIKVGVPKGVVGSTTGFKFVCAGNESVSAQKARRPKPRSRSTTSESAGKKMTKVKESGVVGNSEIGHSMTTTEMRGKGRVAASRSRRNSIENLLSDGESVASSAVDNWDSRSEFSEYNGPKLFVKPSSKSNKQKIQNAITQCVFPGAVNSEMKQKILQELDNVSGVGSSGGNNYKAVDSGGGGGGNGSHFLILFRDHSLKYRAVYLCVGDCSEGEICKVVGTGPSSLKLSMVQDLYKYDSGGKRFVQIPAKTMSVSVDAFTIHNQLWKKK